MPVNQVGLGHVQCGLVGLHQLQGNTQSVIPENRQYGCVYRVFVDVDGGHMWDSGGTYDIYTYALQHTEYFELSCYEDVTAVERPLRVKYRKSFVQ